MANVLTNNGVISSVPHLKQKLTLVADNNDDVMSKALALARTPDEVNVYCSAVSAYGDDTLYPVVSFDIPNGEVDVNTNGEVSGGATATFVIVLTWYSQA